ncbi:MAG: hypothetical protein R3182_04000 [Draconibacterium sp.]|nr:hypothetical protein [Draconibacterium sp.]
MKRAFNKKINQIEKALKRVTCLPHRQASNTNKVNSDNEMKKLASILIIAMAMIIASCEGPIGPPGMPGEPGVDGGIMLGSIFEIEGDFTQSNNYNLYFEFPSSFEIYDTDVVLVYILWEQVDGLDVWRLLPQTVVLPEGVLQYNFDYTLADVQVFLEFTVPESSLRPAETKDQIFRIAVLPADFAAKETVDVTDFNSILKSPEIKLNLSKKINLNDLNFN